MSDLCLRPEHPADSGHEAIDPYYGTPPKPHDITHDNFREGQKVAPPESYGIERPAHGYE